jgi:hypothetical protein
VVISSSFLRSSTFLYHSSAYITWKHIDRRGVPSASDTGRSVLDTRWARLHLVTLSRILPLQGALPSTLFHQLLLDRLQIDLGIAQGGLQGGVP